MIYWLLRKWQFPKQTACQPRAVFFWLYHTSDTQNLEQDVFDDVDLINHDVYVAFRLFSQPLFRVMLNLFSFNLNHPIIHCSKFFGFGNGIIVKT